MNQSCIPNPKRSTQRHMPVEGSNSIFSSHTGHLSLRSYHSNTHLKAQGVEGFRVLDFGAYSMRVKGSGFRKDLLGSGFKLKGFGFRVSDFGFRDPGFGFRVSGSSFWAIRYRCLVYGSGFWVLGPTFRVQDWEVRVWVQGSKCQVGRYKLGVHHRRSGCKVQV